MGCVWCSWSQVSAFSYYTILPSDTKYQYTLGNPFVCVKNVHFDWLNLYLWYSYTGENLQSDLDIFQFDFISVKPHDVPSLFCLTCKLKCDLDYNSSCFQRKGVVKGAVIIYLNLISVNNRMDALCLSQGRRMGYPACSNCTILTTCAMIQIKYVLALAIKIFDCHKTNFRTFLEKSSWRSYWGTTFMCVLYGTYRCHMTYIFC